MTRPSTTTKVVAADDGLQGFGAGRADDSLASGAGNRARTRRRRGLQRLYSTFPGRWPGVGLLLLRAAVGAWAAIEGGALLLGVSGAAGAGASASLTSSGDLAWGIVAIGALAVVGGAALLIGFLTPIAAVVMALLGAARALSWIPSAIPHALDGHAGAWFMTVVAAGIFLLGPGAFSIDSHLFGRREIVIPPPVDTSPARAARQSTSDSRR